MKESAMRTNLKNHREAIPQLSTVNCQLSTVEILAPAGSDESLTAAVRTGADAVYLGGGELNARRSAKNFDDAGLARAVSYCHAREVKVYLTLNTMVLERELSQALCVLEEACALGVDAVIVADPGLASLARRVCPGLPLFASTQMAVTGPRGALALQELGFSRVVLAREMSLDEIRAVAQSCSIELEVFVHGALCMSVSGQCYLSSLIGGRSGNRGLCAQPCRLPFAFESQSHALSLKDLSLIDRMAELADAGVTSLKIEGRMKRPEYVAGAVTACRNALAGQAYDLDELAALFSRDGFTQGYLDGKRGAKMFGIRRKEDVTGASPALLAKYGALYQKERGAVPVDFHLTLSHGQPAELTAADMDGNTVRVTGDIPAPAITSPTGPDKAAAALSKAGGTFFIPGKITCDLSPGLILPASGLNALRRESLAQLSAIRHRLSPLPFKREDATRSLDFPARPLTGHPPEIRVRLASAEQLSGLDAGSIHFISMPVDQIEKLSEDMLSRYKSALAAELPKYEFGGNANLSARLEALRDAGVTRALAGSLAAIKLATETRFTAHGDFSLNIANTPALVACREHGLADSLLSFELALTSAKKLGDTLPRGVIGYGHLPLMHLRNCPAKAFGGCSGCGFPSLRDRKGSDFFLACTNGEAAMYNHIPLWIGDKAMDFTGLDFLTLYFTRESSGQIAEVIARFREGRPTVGPFTRGLYYRGVK